MHIPLLWYRVRYDDELDAMLGAFLITNTHVVFAKVDEATQRNHLVYEGIWSFQNAADVR